jgi:elongation factor 1-beta
MSWLRTILSSSTALLAAESLSSGAQPARPYQANTSVVSAGSWGREKMAEVIVGLRVLPKTVDVDLDKLEEKIKAAISPERMQREPIAFGLVAILVVKLVPDEAGQVDEIEKKLRSIEEVGEVEVTGISRGL